jgi:ABC-type transporter Mla MlaB component
MAATRQRKGRAGAHRRGGARALALGSSLTIVEARAVQRSLSAWLERGRAEADARALERIDTAGLQLLLAVGRTARARGLTLRLSGAPPLLLDAAGSLGLASALTEVVELTP